MSKTAIGQIGQRILIEGDINLMNKQEMLVRIPDEGDKASDFPYEVKPDTLSFKRNEDSTITSYYNFSSDKLEELLKLCYKDGYDHGYADGYKVGYAKGKEEGYKEGYSDGHTAGYNEGYKAGQQSVD